MPKRLSTKQTDWSPTLLSVELVPTTCWFSNLRSELSARQWDVVRRRTYRDAKYRCEICGGKGPKWPVEAHEIWNYDDVNHVQRLVRTIALCPKCHEVKHIGFAESHGHGERAIKHLAKVNGWTLSRAREHVALSYAVWERRSLYDWDLDITWLATKFDVILKR